MTKDELAAKADWEGGIAEAICIYGLAPVHLPADCPESVREAWERLYTEARNDIKTVEDWLWQNLSSSC